MNSKFSDEELNHFLKAAGIDSPPITTSGKPLSIQDEALEKLLDKMMGGSSIKNESSNTYPCNERSTAILTGPIKKRRRMPWTTVWLSIAVLGAFFLGSVFGFYWGHTPRTLPASHTYDKIENQLERLRQDLQNMQQSLLLPHLVPDSHQEIIQPLNFSPLTIR